MVTERRRYAARRLKTPDKKTQTVWRSSAHPPCCQRTTEVKSVTRYSQKRFSRKVSAMLQRERRPSKRDGAIWPGPLCPPCLRGPVILLLHSWSRSDFILSLLRVDEHYDDGGPWKLPISAHAKGCLEILLLAQIKIWLLGGDSNRREICLKRIERNRWHSGKWKNGFRLFCKRIMCVDLGTIWGGKVFFIFIFSFFWRFSIVF